MRWPVKILVEPLPPAGENGNLITNIGRLMKNRAVCRVRTCFEGDTLGSDLLAADLFLAEQRGVFIETLQLPVRLLLFGTGPEIEPITQLGKALGWTVERFDHPFELAQNFRSDTQTAAVVMNHNFGRDLLSLHRLLPLNPICWITRTKKTSCRDFGTTERICVLRFQWRHGQFFAPAGLDIGSEAPEEIALSIVAEIEAVLSGRVAVFCENAALIFMLKQRPSAERPHSSR